MFGILVQWILAALAFLIAAKLVPGFEIDSFLTALIAALVVGVLNIFVWPLIALFTLPLTLLTFGLFLFVVNALVIKLGAFMVPGFTVVGFLPALLGSLVISVVSLLTRWLFERPLFA